MRRPKTPRTTLDEGGDHPAPCCSETVHDAAELHGVLSRLQLLGLTIVDLCRLPD